ncbi:DUF2946 family protein [Ramlibacter tataouinensis]|uniref:DUF2946 domain-containing protein n=1 Tax=Ramlibacter tataouinensis TaxID=94132 RepID=A0A127JU20_9BURK|nr:DUF2946 family protein [Ramlibacter tataouinensis]AMO23466.1 hypothetical protein UC35_11850 [Ramlibacter tataouinensis]
MQASPLKRRITSAVLVWFVAFVVVAGIAPWMQSAQAMDIGMDSICTSHGGPVQTNPQGGGEQDHHAADHTLKCFLCTGVSAPPATTHARPPAVAALGHALRPLVSAQLASLTRAPLPARGPPLFS